MVDKSKGKGTEIWAHPENDTSVQLTFPFGVLYATLFPIISFSNSFLYFNTIYKFFLLCYPPLFVNRKNNGVPYFYNDESAHLTLLILILHSNLSRVSLFPIHLVDSDLETNPFLYNLAILHLLFLKTEYILLSSKISLGLKPLYYYCWEWIAIMNWCLISNIHYLITIWLKLF